MNIRIRKSAIKDLQKISPEQKNRIHQKILTLRNFPNISNVKKLTSFEPAYRLRTGNFRILFDVTDDTVKLVGFYTEKKVTGNK